MKSKKCIYGLCTLSGTIIGVGLFALPYITSQVGIFVVLGYFLGLGSLAIVIHLLFAEVALKTPDFLRMPGFVKYHLGKKMSKLSFVTFISGMFGVILTYLIIGGEFLNSLLSPVFGGNITFYTLLYFAAGALIIFLGSKTVAKIEFLGLVLFFIVLLVIFYRGFPSFSIGNLLSCSSKRDFFLPYGPILFSLWGTALIPEIEEMLGKEKKLLKKIIPAAIFIPIVAYVLFIFLITGITGSATSEEAITGLRDFLGDGIINFALFFGLLTTFTSFIILGLTVRKVFHYDLKISKRLAWAITCFVPLFFFLIGLKDFIPVIAFVGGVFIGIDGILIIMMYQKVKRKIPLFTYPLLLLFVLGIIYQIVYFVK